MDLKAWEIKGIGRGEIVNIQRELDEELASFDGAPKIQGQKERHPYLRLKFEDGTYGNMDIYWLEDHYVGKEYYTSPKLVYITLCSATEDEDPFK